MYKQSRKKAYCRHHYLHMFDQSVRIRLISSSQWHLKPMERGFKVENQCIFINHWLPLSVYHTSSNNKCPWKRMPYQYDWCETIQSQTIAHETVNPCLIWIHLSILHINVIPHIAITCACEYVWCTQNIVLKTYMYFKIIDFNWII